jgi:hypothetical protein
MNNPQTPSERVAALRKRNDSKTMSVSGEAAKALADYQQRHGLPNRSGAILHAIKAAT